MMERSPKNTRLWLIGERLAPLSKPEKKPQADWLQADPAKIAASLVAARQKPSGNWFVIGDRKKLRRTPLTVFFINGREILLSHGKTGFAARSNACPHLGAPLSAGRYRDGHVTCPWHGLRLPLAGDSGPDRFPIHDDGHLIWIRLPGAETDSDAPFLPLRRPKGIAATIQSVLRCDPEQVLANRLDPWHGAHFHPHTFARLSVFREDEEGLFLRVAYRIGGRLCMEVDARFHCPDPRTIVMTIIAGSGRGSIVETHATPIAPGYTRLTELTIAYSPSLALPAAQIIAPLVRPFIRATAKRLWREDAAYAERRYFLEQENTDHLPLEIKAKGPFHHPYRGGA